MRLLTKGGLPARCRLSVNSISELSVPITAHCVQLPSRCTKCCVMLGCSNRQNMSFSKTTDHSGSYNCTLSTVNMGFRMTCTSNHVLESVHCRIKVECSRDTQTTNKHQWSAMVEESYRPNLPPRPHPQVKSLPSRETAAL